MGKDRFIFLSTAETVPFNPEASCEKCSLVLWNFPDTSAIFLAMLAVCTEAL